MKIDDAIKIANQVIESIKGNLDEKYLKVEIHNHINFLSLTCHLPNSISMEFRILEDLERNRINLPNSVKEYHLKGGGKKLTDQIKQYNKDAWKCEVKKHLENNQTMEFGIGINEINYNKQSCIELLNKYFLE
jgi:hypothetical protein